MWSRPSARIDSATAPTRSVLVNCRWFGLSKALCAAYFVMGRPVHHTTAAQHWKSDILIIFGRFRRFSLFWSHPGLTIVGPIGRILACDLRADNRELAHGSCRRRPSFVLCWTPKVAQLHVVSTHCSKSVDKTKNNISSRHFFRLFFWRFPYVDKTKTT